MQTLEKYLEISVRKSCMFCQIDKEESIKLWPKIPLGTNKTKLTSRVPVNLRGL